MQFGINYYSAFLGVYLLELGYSQSLLGVLNCISALSEIPVLLLIHRLSRRYKETVLLTAAVGCMALRLILLSAGNVALMAAAQLLHLYQPYGGAGKDIPGAEHAGVCPDGAGQSERQPAGRSPGQCVRDKRRIFDYSFFTAGHNGRGRHNGRMEKNVK